ncbi:hypothetical protein O3S80_02705 [Streptomyces sp. Lzd4kr]|nr:hypothetical protein [Streptomyces sp. Lzd4kr]
MIPLICERNGLPRPVGISGANLDDSQASIPMMRGIPPVRSCFGPRRRRPAGLHADKSLDFDHLRGWLRRRQIVHIAHRGVERRLIAHVLRLACRVRAVTGSNKTC